MRKLRLAKSNTTSFYLNKLPEVNVILLIVSSVLLSSLFPLTDCYYIVVEQYKQDCYHEYANASTKLGLSFEVLGEGANNVDITIKDPAKIIVHQENSIDSGKYTIEAGSNGNYEFCFINSVPHGQPRYVMFNIDESKASKPPDIEGQDEEKSIAMMARQLHISTVSAKHETSYLVARDKIHRKVSESTNATIARWVVFESIILLLISLVQVWYVRRFFETRRKI